MNQVSVQEFLPTLLVDNSAVCLMCATPGSSRNIYLDFPNVAIPQRVRPDIEGAEGELSLDFMGFRGQNGLLM